MAAFLDPACAGISVLYYCSDRFCARAAVHRCERGTVFTNGIKQRVSVWH
jgi:hypothetical protein